MQIAGMSRLFTALFGCYLFLVLAFGGSEKDSPMDPPLCEVYDGKIGIDAFSPDSMSIVINDNVAGLDIENAHGCVQDSSYTRIYTDSIFQFSSPGK